ncbi:MAG: hypothetical protein U1F52_22575 [Burkholderiales bacterium]
MKQTSRIPAVLLGLALAAGGSTLSAAEHEHAGHKHHDHAPAKLQFDHGRKWATDQTLRKEMETLRSTLAERIEAIHHGTVSPEEYQSLGRNVETRIGNIVAQCKLEPKADAMLHIIIAELGAAADVMQGKTPGKPAAAAHRVVVTLNSYGRYFDHPGWQALK